ncbi:MAG TPA: M1 family aminopeptidase [Polyangia bacterium]|jgi:hypothetical protein
MAARTPRWLVLGLLLAAGRLASAAPPFDPARSAEAREQALAGLALHGPAAAQALRRHAAEARRAELRGRRTAADFEITGMKLALSFDGAAGTIDTVTDLTLHVYQSGLGAADFMVTRLAELTIEDAAGASLAFTYSEQWGRGFALVSLPAGLQAGQEVTLRFRNHGAPVCNDASGMQLCAVTADVVYFASCDWLPGKTPYEYQDLYQPTGVDFDLTTPPGFVAAATTDLASVEDRGDHLVHHFVAQFDESLFGFSTARYDTFTAKGTQQKPVTVYLWDGTREYGPAWASFGADVLDYYSTAFLPYEYHKHDIVQTVPGLGGGIGPQSLAFLWSSLFNRAPTSLRLAPYVSHEMAHSWWGGMCRLGDSNAPFLNEGFAEYSSRLHSYRHWPAASVDALYDQYVRMFGYYVTPDQDVPLSNSGATNDAMVYQFVTYFKGSHVLRTLQWLLGDEVFFQGLGAYAAGHNWEATHKMTAIEDLRVAMQEASGADLSGFFDQWIYGTGYPQYRWAAEFAPAEAGYTVRVRAEQVQEGDVVYDVPVAVDVWVGDAAEPQTFRLAFDGGRVADQTFAVADEPLAVKLDGASWIWGTKTHTLVGDVDSSNEVDGLDLIAVAWGQGADMTSGHYPPNYTVEADLDGDGVIDQDDLAAVLANFGKKGTIE